MGKINLKKHVGFVATGNELVNGDILNTNGQYSAQLLLDNNIEPGIQIAVGDDDKEIKDAIRFLMKDHQAIVTIGGLGPTSDDRTRYALAKATSKSLVFFEDAWQWVVDRIKNLNLAIPENNRQQALLPEGATAIHNRNGTAAACYFHHDQHDFFMLPGPPNEYRPIFNEIVIPHLKQLNFSKMSYRYSWLLLGVSEGIIAEQLESLSLPNGIEIGYRVSYPYLEVKIKTESLNTLENVIVIFDTLLKDQCVSHQQQTASEQLFQYLKKNSRLIFLVDEATGGKLESSLYSPDTCKKLNFLKASELEKQLNQPRPILIHIKGLEAYWKQTGNTKEKMPLSIEFIDGDQRSTVNPLIPFRNQQSMDYAVEMICWELGKLFRIDL